MPGCSAPGCKNRVFGLVTFHKFPKSSELRRKWLEAVNKKDWEPKSSSVLCSKHFREEDIDRTSVSCVRLRENAVPSFFPDDITNKRSCILKRCYETVIPSISDKSSEKEELKENVDKLIINLNSIIKKVRNPPEVDGHIFNEENSIKEEIISDVESQSSELEEHLENLGISSEMEETDNICFVCDQNIPGHKWKYQLQVTATKRRNAPVADLIQELVGDEFEVLVGERDAVCSKCMNLLNLMDSLSFQLGEVKTTLTQLLHAKYNLAGEDTKLQVEYDDSTQEESEPLLTCEICNYQTKYEKELNRHLQRHSAIKAEKSPVVTKPKVPKMVNTTNKRSPKGTPKISPLKTKSKSTKKKTPKTSPKKNLLKKKTKNTPKEKKKKIVFECSVCSKVFPDEDAIRLHCKKDHGNDKIVVSDEEEYEDIQTLETSDDEDMKKTTKRKDSTKINLDFLDDWVEDEDNDDLHSPSKKHKPDKSENEPVSTKLKNLFRSSLRESFDDEDEMEKDVSSQPTCMFCNAKFSSFEAVQDHVKLSHGTKSLPKPQLKATSASVASFEIDSTTDIDIGSQSNKKPQKPKMKSFKCNLCGIKKVSLEFVKEHVKTHKRKMSLQCKKCGVAFKKVISLKVHAYKCRKVGSSLIKCKKCQFKFLNVIQLKNHFRKVHHKQNLIKKKDPKCKNTTEVSVENSNPNNNRNVTKSTQLNKISSAKKSSKTDDSKISISEVSSTSIENESKQKEKGRKQTQHRCLECNIDFAKPSELQTHRLRHTANTCTDLGICVFCEKLFLSKEHLTIHVKTMHEDLYKDKPKCSVCYKQYSLGKDLKLHYLRCHFSEKSEKFVKQVSEYKNKEKVTKLKTDENDVYNKVFKELQDLTGEGNDTSSEDMSVNEIHPSPLKYNCPVCNFCSQEDEEVRSHLPSHVQHYCNICAAVFRPEEVISHIENHSIDFQGVKCPLCEKECHDDIHLQAHIQCFHSESKRSLQLNQKRQFRCNMCEKSFFTEKTMLSHRALKHGEKTKKVLSCGECKKDFFSEKSYQTHVEFAHRSGLNCKYCDKSFDNVKKLVFHENNHLKKIKSIIKCNICGKVLKSKQALKTHKSVHKSSSSLCEVCNKTFKSYHSLREHSASHSRLQEKKYFCEICGKGFYFYDSHARHRRLHLDPLLFQCRACKERFQTKLKLVEHKKTCNISKEAS